jgi:hypothetical protein
MTPLPRSPQFLMSSLSDALLRSLSASVTTVL